MIDSGIDDESTLLVLADRVHTLAPRPVHGQAPAHGGPAPAPTTLLVSNGRVVAAGAADGLRARATRARVLDLRGTTITPGLTDAHVHLTEWAFARREVDLAEADSPEQAAVHVASFAREHDAGWIRGRGWNPHRWGGRPPERHFLDAAVGDRPVALQSHDMHALWVNTAALRAAGIDAATPDPEGGHIVRDARGEPTGLLLEWAGLLVARHFPVPSVSDAAAAVLAAQSELHTLGITGVHSFPGVQLTEPDPLPVLLQLREQQQLRLRVLQHIRLERLEEAVRLGLRSGFGDDWLRMGAVKMFLDGALGSRTAWMRAPYEDGSGCGMNTLHPDEFRAHVARAAAAGIATTVHAIGDAAVELALDVLAAEATRVRALPHRIEHVQCCPPERFADAARAGIIASMQPSHLITDWSIADRHWGELRSRGAFALASLHAHDTVFAFGSDVPVEPVDPRRGFFAALARQDLAHQPPGGWYPDERIDAETTLRGYTIGPARAAGLPAPHGSLLPGAPADLVAWDIDPLAASPDQLLQMRCVATIVGGVVVHH